MTNVSWGTKIAIVYISFVVLILSMVALAMNQKIELESEDYYAKELKFQNTIDETNNANALTEKVSHEISSANFKLIFPQQFKSQKVSGTIEFYRPSDKSKDFIIPVSLNQNLEQFVALENFVKGKYEMKIGWECAGKKYYTKEIIVMP